MLLARTTNQGGWEGSRRTMTRQSQDNPPLMSLGEHLEDLRKRVFWALAGILPFLGLGLYFGKDILQILVRPLEKAALKNGETLSLQTTALFEGFNTWVKVGVLVMVICGAPWILYQLWKFVAPGLYAREQRFARVLAPLSVVMTCAGMLFLYFVVLTFALDFFVHFNKTLLVRHGASVQALPSDVAPSRVPVLRNDPPEPKPGDMWINHTLRQLRVAINDKLEVTKTESSSGEEAKGAATKASPVIVLNLPLQSDSLVNQHYKVSEYLSTVLTFAIAFAIAFQTPVVVLLLGWVGIIHPDTMRKHRKYAFLVCTVIGALCAPPDPFSMLALMFPLYFLYELGLLLLRLMPAQRVAEGDFFRRRAGASPSDVGGENASESAQPGDDPYSRPDDR